MSFQATGHWLKGNLLFVALIALLFVAAIVERGLIDGLWMAGALCYMGAIMWFCSIAIPATVFRTRLSWPEWSLLAFASCFAVLAYALGVPQLIKVGLFGLATGIVLGVFFLYFAWRVRAK